MAKTKILFLGAHPAGQRKMRIDVEAESIREVIQAAGRAHEVEIRHRMDVSFEKFQDALSDELPDYVHISCHCEEGRLLFAGRAGNLEPIDGALVVETLCNTRRGYRVRGVLLNACQSDALAELASRSLDFAVGMADDISDPAALLYARGFYRGLVRGQSPPVEWHEQGREGIRADRLGEHDTPRFFPGGAGVSRPAAAPSPAAVRQRPSPIVTSPLPARGGSTSPGAAAARPAAAGTLLSRAQLDQVVDIALAHRADRSLLLGSDRSLLALLPEKSSPRDQLESDVLELARMPELAGLPEAPLEFWLGNLASRVRLFPDDARFVEELLAAVKARRPAAEPAAGPAADDVLPRLRAAVREALRGEGGDALQKAFVERLRAAGASALPTILDEVVDTLLGMEADDIIEHLNGIAADRPPLRDAARRVAKASLPAAIDWARVREAAVRGAGAGEPHLTLDFLLGPLCEVAVASVSGRPAFLDDERECPANVAPSSAGYVPLLDQDDAVVKTTAEWVLEKLGVPPEGRGTTSDEVVKAANDAIIHRREKSKKARYQMYLLFRDGQVGPLRERLHELWFVKGKSRAEGISLYLSLRELFEWPDPKRGKN